MSLEKTSMTSDSLFFDTYAFIKILEGSEEYAKYSQVNIITTKLNIFELYFALLKRHGEKIAEEKMNEYYPFVKEYDDAVIKEAARLKYKLNNRDVSMTDCIGYCLAKQLGIKFLTGDKEFEKLDNVEFVN